MKKQDIAKSLMEKSGMTMKAASEYVDLMFDAIADGLVKGEEISIRGFGRFFSVEHKARDGRNPKTGEVIKIAEKRHTRFKPGKELTERLQK